MLRRSVIVPTLALIAASLTAAEEAAAPPAKAPAATPAPPIEELVVVGTGQADAARLPGTAVVLDPDLLDLHHHTDVHAVMRQVPGANTVSEDAFGLRANIGFRGVSPIRSTKVHVMEDGVPIAPNPYNDPGLYVGPAYGRFEAVEIIKGSGQIQYGPHTVAGVANFKSKPLTFTDGAAIDLAAGSHDTVTGQAMIEAALATDLTLAVDLYGFDSAGYRPHDAVSQQEIVGRLGWRPAEGHLVVAKVLHGVEDSSMTYQGLSRADFEQDPYNRYDFTAGDRKEAMRRAASLRHRWDYGEDGRLITTLYTQEVDRNWDRHFHTFDAVNETYTSTLSGGADRRARARRYWFHGAEVRWHDTTEAGMPVAWDAGARLHREGQVNTEVDTNATTNARLMRSRIDRDTTALAGWLQADAEVARGLHIIPGVRVEHLDITSQRKINNGVAATDPKGDSTLTEVLPGLGFTAELGHGAQLYGGVHRGFSPPSYSQAVLTSGVDAELDAETSWNYEIGLRYDAGPALTADLAVFLIDWDNIVTTPLANQPGVNAGSSRHHGAELLIESDPGLAAGLDFGLPVRLSAGWVRAEYSEDAFSNGTLVASAGNTREYAPELTVAVTTGIEGVGPRRGIHAYLTVSHVGKQFSDGLNTVEVTADGGRGELDAITLVDLTAKWKPADASYEVYLTGRNVLDHEYAAFRRSGQGTVAGAPLTALVGMSASF